MQSQLSDNYKGIQNSLLCVPRALGTSISYETAALMKLAGLNSLDASAVSNDRMTRCFSITSGQEASRETNVEISFLVHWPTMSCGQKRFRFQAMRIYRNENREQALHSYLSNERDPCHL